MNARTMLALGAAMAALAGCGSTPSCDKVVRHVAEVRDLGEDEVRFATARCQKEDWPDALRSCAMKATTADEIDACTSRSARERAAPTRSYGDYMARGRSSEAELNLHKLERALRTHFLEYAQFPDGEAGPSPPGRCCSEPKGKCAANPAVWDEMIWRELDFSVDEASYYRYSYRSSGGRTAIVEATGDLDCDGEPSTFTLRCDSDDGSPSCAVEKPARID